MHTIHASGYALLRTLLVETLPDNTQKLNDKKLFERLNFRVREDGAKQDYRIPTKNDLQKLFDVVELAPILNRKQKEQLAGLITGYFKHATDGVVEVRIGNSETEKWFTAPLAQHTELQNWDQKYIATDEPLDFEKQKLEVLRALGMKQRKLTKKRFKFSYADLPAELRGNINLLDILYALKDENKIAFDETQNIKERVPVPPIKTNPKYGEFLDFELNNNHLRQNTVGEIEYVVECVRLPQKVRNGQPSEALRVELSDAKPDTVRELWGLTRKTYGRAQIFSYEDQKLVKLAPYEQRILNAFLDGKKDRGDYYEVSIYSLGPSSGKVVEGSLKKYYSQLNRRFRVAGIPLRLKLDGTTLQLLNE